MLTPARGAPQFDLTFPRMPCGWMSLDVMDVSGELELDVVSGRTLPAFILGCWVLGFKMYYVRFYEPGRERRQGEAPARRGEWTNPPLSQCFRVSGFRVLGVRFLV